MKIPRRVSLPIFLLSAAVSVLWGSAFALKDYVMTDFRAVYYGTRCLLEHHNPYSVSELERVVANEHGERPSETPEQHQAVSLYVNLPSTFIFVAPFAAVPFGVARLLWLALLTCLFLISSFLMFDIGARYAPGVSLFLVCLVLVNSQMIFKGGNTAGVAVPLCLVGVWAFLQERAQQRIVVVGVACMALSLAIKPHDSGLIWLYFFVAGGVYRRRALQSLAGTVALFFVGLVWVSSIAPHWMKDWNTNLSVISTHGHINDPGPASIVGFHNLGPVIDLQSILSVIRDNPSFYNPVTYLVCGALLSMWAVASFKSRISKERALLALAAVTPLTLLITYHRPWDAKLLLLTCPGCAILWASGRRRRWPALLITFATLVASGDIGMAIFLAHPASALESAPGLTGQIATILLARPIAVLLVIMSLFYVWAYLRNSRVNAYVPAIEGALDNNSRMSQPQEVSTAGSPIKGERP